MQAAEAYDELPDFITRRDQRREKKRIKAQLRQRRSHNFETAELKLPDIKRIQPLTENQRLTFQAFNDDKNLLLHGVAGTGKTFIALYLALSATLQGKAPKPIVILRSVVPSRDMGFLPGKIEEKIQVYEEPYRALCAELSGRKTSYNYLKDQGYIEFSTTSYLRGLTFRDNTVLVDEVQNMSFHELDTVMTRLGDGCRVIFCGDFRQTDLQRSEDRAGLHKFMDVLHDMKSFQTIEFTEDDVVRSGLVKEYIMTKLNHGMV